MQISVLLAHPSQTSFNHAIARVVVDALKADGHKFCFHDLCTENFPPLIPAGETARGAELPPVIAQHCAEIAQADGIIVVHPNWWGQPPAILKGWVDRVIRPGVAYEFNEGDSGEGVPNGLLKARAAIVFNTSNTPPDREDEVFGDPLQTLWQNCVFGLCGVATFHRRNFRVVVTSTPQQRQEWLDEACDIVRQFFPAE
jgi:putative NADPH-quinone reductase